MKEEILKKIDEALITEEKAIPIYGHHIESTLFWSGLEQEHRQKMKKMILALKEESEKHIGLLHQIKKLVSERY